MSIDPTVAAAEVAFQQAENLAYHLFAPPAAANVQFGDPPVAPAVSQGANGPEVYTSAIQTQILDQANAQLAQVMTPTLANDTLSAVSAFISKDNGPNMDVIGGERADVLSFNSVNVAGTNAAIGATVNLWTDDGTMNPGGQLIWHVIQSHVIIAAQMVLGTDGQWRESSQTLTFAPGWTP